MNNPAQIQISISNFANILNIHQRTLRIWDKEGVLVPKRTEKTEDTIQ